MIDRLRKAYQRFVNAGSDPNLLNELSAAMEDQINKINNTSAARIGSVENEINLQIDMIRVELRNLADLNAQRHRDIKNDIVINREATSSKLHSLSNHMMGLTSKIDELAELVMAQHDRS